MTPQPLPKNIDPDSVTFSPDALSERPTIAAKVMQVIALWSCIDASYTDILCETLESDMQVVYAMYSSIRNAFTRADMVRGALEFALKDDKDGLSLFKQVEGQIKASRSKRNDFCHFLWGTCPSIKNGLCLIDPKHFYSCHTALHAYCRHHNRALKSKQEMEQRYFPYDLANSQIQIYKERDLVIEVKAAERARVLVRLLPYALSHDAQMRLDFRPIIAEALASRSNPRHKVESVIDKLFDVVEISNPSRRTH